MGNLTKLGRVLSRRGQVKPPLNLAAPSAKAKYSWKTDSVRVP